MFVFVLINVLVSLVLTKEEVKFTSITGNEFEQISDKATLTCSVIDYMGSFSDNDVTSRLYDIEFAGNWTTDNDVSGKIYSILNDNFTLVHKYTIHSTNDSKNNLITASNQYTCMNNKNNIILTSYELNKKQNKRDTIPYQGSIYYRLLNTKTMKLSNETLVLNGSTYENNNQSNIESNGASASHSNYNFNFNSNTICNYEYNSYLNNNISWYLISWYHWDYYKTYLQYQIVWTIEDNNNTNFNNFKSSNIISAYSTTIDYVSIYISSFGRSKTIQSISNKNIFLSVYDDFNVNIDPLTEYSTNAFGIIGNIYYNNSINNYYIKFNNNKPIILNQVNVSSLPKHDRRAISTGTLQSSYVYLTSDNLNESNDNLNDVGCCFVILYGVSWTDEVWGVNELYITIVNDLGEHILQNEDILVHHLGWEKTRGGNPLLAGFYGNSQVTQLTFLQSNNIAYFMVTYTITAWFFDIQDKGDTVTSKIYKLTKDNNNNKYTYEEINTNQFYKKTDVSDTFMFNLCIHQNNNNNNDNDSDGKYKSNQVFVGFTEDKLINGIHVMSLMANVYNYSLA